MVREVNCLIMENKVVTLIVDLLCNLSYYYCMYLHKYNMDFT